MFDWVKAAPYIILVVAVVGFGMWVKELNDANVLCKAEKQAYIIQKDKRAERYDKDMKVVVEYYDNELLELEKFKRRKDETDCEATRRFFDGRSYD